jgi:hypothetical protein
VQQLRWLVPVAILVVGYWLIAPLVAPGGAPGLAPPGIAPPESTTAETVNPPRAVPTSPPPGKPAASGPARTPAAASASPAELTAPATSTPVPAPTPSPTPSTYRASPVENLKIEPRATELVRLGRIEAGTAVRMTLAVRFNVGISSISGVPDVDVQVVGPTGTVASYPNARDGVRVDFRAPASGDYELRLDNTRSRLNAKRVTVQFG